MVPRTSEIEAEERPAPSSRRRFLGEMLRDQGVIRDDQLTEALALQKREKGTRLGRLLVDLGYATEAQICEVIAEQLRIPAADLVAIDVAPAVLALLPKEIAFKYACLPWMVEGKELYLIMADPTNIAAADEVAFRTGLKVKPVVAPESEVQAALERFYAAEEDSLAQFENLDLAGQVMTVEADDTGEGDTQADEVQTGPVVKLVNAILVDGIRAGASDVHIEPQEKSVQLRYRVDGMLRQVMTMPKRVQGRLISRMKIMAHLDISERRKPQDGRARLSLGGKNYDLRVSTLPAADGEKIVVRVLVQERAKVSLEDLGFEAEVLASLKDLLKRPQGMVLVTGPTGSGKTSTLYAALNFLKHETTNIVTVEDPIEYRLAGVNQVAVSDKAGLTFAAGLRSILRQDPNVIMIGEIRDLETALIAFQAAQTGHMVLSTLHTNDAPSAITRLVEMGIPAYLVASSVVAVMAQRLVRRLCDCKTADADGTVRPKGCESCRFSGYRGRMAVYELMRLTPRVRSVVMARGGDDLVRSAAQASGMQTMYGDGRRKADAGQTTVEEVLRVVPPDEEDDVPAAGAPPPSMPVSLSADAGRARRSRIVVAEDDGPLRDVISEILTSENYEVLPAETGEDALNLVYREHPDLVLTDLNMPRMNGIELLKRLRGDLSTCQIPVVFLTVEGAIDTEVQALSLGADDYLTKPVERGRLLGRVRRALFRNRLRVTA